MKQRSISKVWTVLLVLLFFYLFYQLLYGWEQSGVLEGNNSEIPVEQVALIVINEKRFPSKSNSLEPIIEGLKVWEYDKEKEKVYFKFSTLLPNEKSKVMVVYDRGFESFERRAEVFSVNIFPYLYYFEEQPFVSVYDADSDGTVYLEFQGKRIKLAPNDTYRTASFNSFQLSNISVKNYGLLKKEQFEFIYTPEAFYSDLSVRIPGLSRNEQTALKTFAADQFSTDKKMSTKAREALLQKTVKAFLEKNK